MTARTVCRITIVASSLGLVGLSRIAGAATGGVPASSARATLGIGAQPTSRDSAAVAAVVGGFHDALARGDSSAALALLAPDVRILESGGVETLADYRAHHLPADIEFARAVPATRGPLGVAVRGDVAWAVSTSETKGEFRARPVNSAGAELMVLTRTAGGWRSSAIHWSSRRRTS